MKISVITPSIRPDGLKTTFNTLKQQTLPQSEWEWLPRLSIPGEKPDLCYQMNQALKEAKGELIVFLQDHIEIEPNALERCWQVYQEHPDTCYTMPVGKRRNDGIEWDWRLYWKHRDTVPSDRWEIDFGMCPTKAIRDVGFDERYDSGFGWENVDTAYLLEKQGWKFSADPENKAVAFDHDANEPHPFKKKTNAVLWATRKAVIDLIYEKETTGEVQGMQHGEEGL